MYPKKINLEKSLETNHHDCDVGPFVFIEKGIKEQYEGFVSSIRAAGKINLYGGPTEEEFEQHCKEHTEHHKKYEAIQQETIERINLTYNSLYLIPSKALEDKWLERVVKFLALAAQDDWETAKILLNEIGYYNVDQNDSCDCYSCKGGGLELHGRFGPCLTCGGSGKVSDESN